MKHSFAPSTAFFGVDVAKKTLVVHCHNGSATRTLGNDRPSISAWLAGLPAGAVIACESTANYHRLLLDLAHAQGFRCYLLNPMDVHHYARSLGSRSKTDHVDAQLIARYVANEHAHLHAWQPASVASQALDGLIKRRAQLVRSRTALAASFAGMPEIGAALTLALRRLDALLKVLEARIRAAVKALPEGAATAQRLASIPGVGPLTSSALTNLFARVPFTGVDSTVAFVGMDPRANDSGEKRGRRRLTKRGPSELRRLLYNAAMAAARNPLWKPYFQRDRSKGLSSTAAYVALARRLLRLAFTLFRSRSMFDPNKLALKAA